MIRTTKILVTFVTVLIAAGVLGMASYINTLRLIKSNDWVVHTHEVMENLGDILSMVKDAEIGQRGFIVSGQEHDLEPYNRAVGQIDNLLAKVGELTQENRTQQATLVRLRTIVKSKLDELKQTIKLRRESGLETAMPVVLRDSGRRTMEDVRTLIAEMQAREQELLLSRQRDSEASARWAMWTITGAIPLSLLVLAIAAFTLLRGDRSSAAWVAGPPAEISDWRKIVARYAFALIMAAIASVLRAWLLRFGPMPLFITFYPAVLLVAMLSGGGPGILTTAASGLVVAYYFVPPYGNFAIESPGDMLSLAIFSGTNLSLCVLAERLRRSRWAEAFARAKQQEAEELARKNEELAQQSEELSQQSEELAQQNEELQSQSEEIQSLNAELLGRESMLQKLLDAARLLSSEESVLKEVCGAAKDIFGQNASAVVICERQADQLAIRSHAGLSEAPESWPMQGAFPGLVIQEGRTACLNDISLRPDLQLLKIKDADPFLAALSSPVRVKGGVLGAVTVYSRDKQEWTTEQFRLIEWLAIQCGHILETLRLQEALRQTAEQNRLLSGLLEKAEQPFGIGYPDGRLGHVNAAFERLTGYRREELAGMDWASTLTPPQWREIERTKLEELNRTGDPVRYEKEYLRKDGVLVPIELLVHLVKDDRGLPLYYYSFITNISERKRMHDELKRSKDELEQRVQERTMELSQTVSALQERSEQLQRMTTELSIAEQRERQQLAQVLHDGLQQILVGAKWRLAVMEREKDAQSTKDRVEELIDDAIEVSRSLTVELSPPILLQGDLFSALEWLARWMHDKHGLEVNLTAHKKIPPLKGGAFLLLFQAARELLFNIVKHSGVRTAGIEVNQVDRHILMKIEDEGAGFDPGNIRSKGGKLGGMGLFGISERLSFIGGRIEIDSTPGSGSRIRLSIPLSVVVAEKIQVPAEAQVSVAISPDYEAAPTGTKKKVRIMLVDDHIVMRQGLAGLLRCEEDFEVAGEASDGNAAVTLAREVRPDIILMDIGMPGMDGIQATRIIHGELPDIRIIGLSMFNEGEQGAAMLEAGAVKYLSKTGPTEAVIEAIRNSARQ